MKVLIQGLGEAPEAVEYALLREKPEVTYILCSNYQLNYVARRRRYPKRNEEVVNEAAQKVGAKVVFKRCNVFDPASINKTLREILKEIDPYKEEIVINYAGGSAPVRLFLGVLGVELAKFTTKTKILYTIYYPKGIKMESNHTEKLQEFLPTDINLLLGFMKKRRPPK
jgi:hypothetical protein